MSLVVIDGAIFVLTTTPDCSLMGFVRSIEIVILLINEWALIMNVIERARDTIQGSHDGWLMLGTLATSQRWW